MIWNMWPVFIVFSFVLINIIIRIDNLYVAKHLPFWYRVIMIWLIYATRKYDLTSEAQTLEALQNAFILIYRCNIYPCYAYILFTCKKQMFYRLYFFTATIWLSHTLKAFVRYGYVVILWNVCNLLSSLLSQFYLLLLCTHYEDRF